MATAPTAEVKSAAARLAPGRALDLACGYGRHAIWLHQQGWQVTAVDRDPAAILQLRQDFPSLDSRVVDLEQDASLLPPDSCRLVVCWLYFQRDLLPRIRQAVEPGGIAALSALLDGRFAAGPGELLDAFSGWTVLHDAQSAHGPGKRSSQLIVQRPA